VEVKGLSKEYYSFRLKIAILKSLIWYFYLGMFVVILFFGALLILIDIYGEEGLILFLRLLPILIFIIIPSILPIIIHLYYLRWYNRKYVDSYEYEITEEEVIIREGVFRRYESRVPFSRIQNIGIHQKFWEKRFGWYRALIQTAGGTIKIGTRAEGCLIGLKDPFPIQEFILNHADKYLKTRITGLEELESFQEKYHLSKQGKKTKLNYKEYNKQLEKIISALKLILEKI